MKKLKDILPDVEVLNASSLNTDVLVAALAFDSRKVVKNTAFFAIGGTQVDGHNYIQKAIELGANVIFVSKKEFIQSIDNVCFVLVKDVSKALAVASKNFYDNPSNKLKLIGVTGTNGKTTTVTLLYNLFKLLGHKSGLISTVKYLVGDKEYNSTHTTPNVLRLNQLLSEMVLENCEFVFMEVSSHAIHQNRIEGLSFSGGVFTNITHDHLDYHKTFKEYIHTKKAFFDNLSPDAFVLTNQDDRNGEVMVQNTKATVFRYGLKSLADFKAKIMSQSMEGMELEFNGKTFFTSNVGVYNCYNLLVTYAVSFLLKQNKELTLNLLSKVEGARGRFEAIRNPENGVVAIVDYAHTDDALKKLLKAINNVRNESQKIITVIGCGGDRDKTKRPLMAKVAVQLSDYVFVTSDNPRTEEPDSIIEDMWLGIEELNALNAEKITDRKQAIAAAVVKAKNEDIIVVAGKGHEAYQEIKGVKYPFDDSLILKQLFNYK